MTSRATSFATLKDLRGYINCLLSGKSETTCYSYGDNGTGAWGDNTAQLDIPMVALSPNIIADRWGSSSAGRGKKVLVLLKGVGHGKEFEAIVGDKGPEGVIDLNPAALEAAGLRSDTELNVEAEWYWKDPA